VRGIKGHGGTRGTARGIALLVATLSACACILPAASSAAPRPTNRYTLANGCYQLRSSSLNQLVIQDNGRYAAGLGDNGERFRMEATGLGTYLLYGHNRDFLGVNADHTISNHAAPSDATVWEVNTVPGGFSLVNPASGDRLGTADDGALTTGRAGLPGTFGFEESPGCAFYPESDINAFGRPGHGTTPDGTVRGIIDPHSHVSSYEFLGGDFHCGRPFHPFGIPFALPDCESIQGPNGDAAPFQNFLDFGTPVSPHDTKMWPTFGTYPFFNGLSVEGDYYRWIQRAWMGGLRIMVTQLVDNEVLCQVYPRKHNACNDMDAVRLQQRDMYAMQDYIDAQFGGPGKGFFRIVTDPFQARQVVSQGKLAVVLGAEVSRVLGCGVYQGVPECDKPQIDAGLDEIQRLGIRTFFPIHKFDNAFGGVRMDGGELGLLINMANFKQTGEFWHVQTCTTPEHDNDQITVPSSAVTDLLTGALAGLDPGQPLPVYPATPHCNTLGLTDLGRYLLGQMIKRHLIIEVDHMDSRAADETLNYVADRHYSGIISAHTWVDPLAWRKVYATGGMVTPITEGTQSFIDQWRYARNARDSRYTFGIGYGADMNGLHGEPGPRFENQGNPVVYPFKSLDGRVTLDRLHAGEKTWDYNQTGVANYGLFPDWIEDLRIVGGQQIADDMENGAEAYLQMWERTVGVPMQKAMPKSGTFATTGIGGLRLGSTSVTTLRRAGQPALRPPRSFRYRVLGGGMQSAVLSPARRVVLVSSTARGDRAGGVAPGAPASAVTSRATPAGAGVYSRPAARGRRFVYRVVRGRVRSVGVASVAPAWLLRARMNSAGA
jgi:hypothetical protein